MVVLIRRKLLLLPFLVPIQATNREKTINIPFTDVKRIVKIYRKKEENGNIFNSNNHGLCDKGICIYKTLVVGGLLT